MLYVRVQFYFICLLLPFKMHPRELFYLCRSSGGKIVLKNKLIQMCKHTDTHTQRTNILNHRRAQFWIHLKSLSFHVVSTECVCCSFFLCTIKVIGNRNVLSVACMVRDVSNSMWNVRNDSSTTPNSKKVSGCVNTHAPLNECCIHAEFIMATVCDNLIVIFRIWEPIAPSWNCPKI